MPDTKTLTARWSRLGVQAIVVVGLVAVASIFTGGLNPLAIAFGLLAFGVFRIVAKAFGTAFAGSEPPVPSQEYVPASSTQNPLAPPPPPDAPALRPTLTNVGASNELSSREWTVFAVFFMLIPYACVLVSSTLYYVWRKERPKKAKQINLLGFAVFAVQLLVYFLYAYIAAGSSDVELIKSSRLPAYPQVTIGEVIGNYLSTPRWESSADGQRRVTATGRISPENGSPILVSVEFKVEGDGGGKFSICRVKFDGEPLNEEDADAVLKGMFERAERRKAANR
jgi:hypothetical protein